MRAACFVHPLSLLAKMHPVRASAWLVAVGGALLASEASAQGLYFPPPSSGPRPNQPAQTQAQPAPAPLAPAPAATKAVVAPAPMVNPAPATSPVSAQPVTTAPRAALPSTAQTDPTNGVSTANPTALAGTGSDFGLAGGTQRAAGWPPAVLPYRENMPIPEGYRLESHINRGLTYGGLSLWVAPYLTGLVAAAASGFTKQSGWLAVPIAGPFLAMGHRSIDCNVVELDVSGNPSGPSAVNAKQEQCLNSAIKEVRIVALLTLDGIMQSAGAIVTIAGLLSSEDYLLRKDIFPGEIPVRFDAGYQQGQFRLTARGYF